MIYLYVSWIGITLLSGLYFYFRRAKFTPKFYRCYTWFLAALVAIAGAFIYQGPILASKDLIYHHATVEAKVRHLIRREYYKDITDTDLHYGALKGMMDVLDPYSAFIPPKKVREFEENTTGKFGGLGIIIEVQDKVLRVVTPIEGTPAHKAGILAGDQILRIKTLKNGKWIEREADFETVEEARNNLIGKPGTVIYLTIYRPSTEEEKTFKLTRAIITIKSVKSAKILDAKHGIAYLRITSFQSDTTAEFIKALHRLQNQLQGRQLQGLILDLRFNPGGLLDQAKSLVDQFISKGVIVQIRGRNQKRSLSIYASSGGAALKIPRVAVLINRGSASASEIVAGALQDHHRAVLVGSRSWGKGSVQTVWDIPEGRDSEGQPIISKIKLTTARYFTPKGRSIHRELKANLSSSSPHGSEKGGLQPDVEVPTTSEENLLLLHKRQEEDIQEEKAKLHALSPQKQRRHQQIQKEFENLIHFNVNIHYFAFAKSRLKYDLFEDRVLKKALEILKDPKKYQKILKNSKY
ncbi:MAG: S41 family peptidase [Planctomycetota bacterium]|nr:MAG: S41 family peptidase [Planctomycetota bacterium]